MRLARVEIEAAPDSSDRVRLSAEVNYRTPGRAVERLWFEVDERIAGSLSRTGNPWIAALAPLAAALREPLEITLPVDAMLRDGIEALIHVWTGWYPDEIGAIPIECDMIDADRGDRTGRTVAFFSGGVDSFHTLLRHQSDGDAHHRQQIDDLLTVHGLDIPLQAVAAFDELRRKVDAVAAATDKQPVFVATNLRESGWNAANWARLSQGPGLAAISLALESRYSRVLIPSSIAYHSITHWGTHPLTDPLLSTSRTAIRDDGALLRRSQKLAAIATNPLAMNNLRVCWMGGDASNCGRCEKCLRTLTVLELIGRLDRAVTFPPQSWSLDALAALKLRHELDRRSMTRLAAEAERYQRADVARAGRRSIRRYDIRRRLGDAARAVGLR